MLKFDSLDIIGFKSFAEKVRVTFDDRTTCIVGPNGCGKSNVADAISWVLGAHSARSLRGDKMEEVIFNGTAKRKPSGLAEVTLTVQRTGETPILIDGVELTADRIEVTRRVDRSGDSVFILNGKRCRMKDIQQFLEEAKLGFASYALIAQGNIESFLSSKPLDRRAVIEEAAGILGYKSRRRSAELKLELAQQNLLRINDIIGEIERQLRSLKRQAAAARRYREIKQEFREIQRKKYAIEASSLQEKLRGIDQNLEAVNAEEEGLRSRLEEAQAAYRVSLERREILERQLAETRSRLATAHLEVDRTRNSIQYHEDQIAGVTRRIEIAAEEQQKLSQALLSIADERKRYQTEAVELEAQEKRAATAAHDQAALLEKHRREMQESERAIESLRTGTLKLSGEIVTIQNQDDQLGHRQEIAAGRRERVLQERATLDRQLDDCRARLQELEATAGRRQAEADLLRQSLEELQGQKAELQDTLASVQAEASELRNQGIACRERLQSLEELELSHAQYSEGVQKFLNHLQQSQTVRISGTLAESVEAHPDYERLFEEVLGDELEYLLVDTMDEAVKGVTEFRSVKGGRCTFLSLRSSNGFGKAGPEDREIPPNREEGVHGSVLNLLDMRPEVEDAFRRVLPETASAVVVSDLDRAFGLAHEYPNKTFLTLQGEVLTPRGLLSASSTAQKKLGLLALKRQRKDLEKKSVTLQKATAAADHRQHALQAQFEAVSGSFAAAQESLHQLEKASIGLAHDQQQGESEQRRLTQAIRIIEDECRQLDRDDQEAAKLRADLQKQAVAKRQLLDEAQSSLVNSQTILEQLRVEFGRIQEQCHLLSSDRKVMEERRAAAVRTLQRVEEQQAGLQARLTASGVSEEQDRDKQKELQEELAELAAKLQERGAEEQNATLETAQLQEAHAAWKAGYPEIEARLNQLREQVAEIHDRKGRLDVERARLETQVQNAAIQCVDQLGVGLDEIAREVPIEGLDLEAVNHEYGQMKNRLEQFGPINMTALEEYQQSEERYSFLTRQRSDIEQSIADTTRAINEINKRSRELFREAFEAINVRFKQVFAKLFAGGDCGMELIGEEDLLESGIDIYVQPPGKRVQNVMLLSGGEKAMTVLALLVALFYYRPSQFCVLDEVDAPLDDANVQRFTALVKEMSQETQFIVITHNKRTMEIANYIYGVTMEEPGVSKVVSVRF